LIDENSLTKLSAPAANLESTASASALNERVPTATPSIKRRLACLPYEGLILLALLLISTFPFAGMKGAALSGSMHAVLQIYLSMVAGGYFLVFWLRSGQTLAMKTWRIKVCTRNNEALTFKRALIKLVISALFYGPACVGLVLFFFPARIHPAISAWLFLPLVATILWARFDVDRQFLHDRLAGTRIVDAKI
jgi:uncharacterized RDD family membrane protein YckC